MEKQISATGILMLIENVKNAANRPAEWLRQYYSAVLEREINLRQTWLLLEVQAAFFAGIMPADYPLLLRVGFCLWFLVTLQKCRKLGQATE